MCSHKLSYHIYADSINNNTIKDAQNCKDLVDIPNGCSKKAKVMVGGEPINESSKGIYVVKM